MLESLIELANGEIGYTDNNGRSKYFEDIFPGIEKELPWCLPFIEDLFVKIYGRERALEMLYMIGGEFICSVPAHVSFVKAKGRWHYKKHQAGWLIYLRMNYEWTNHIEFITKVKSDDIISVGGNCGGRVRENTWRKDDPRISGYAEILY